MMTRLQIRHICHGDYQGLCRFMVYQYYDSIDLFVLIRSTIIDVSLITV